MLKAKIVLLALASAVFGNLTGCGAVANYFPDKEKDYQRIKEIPMLTWPTELRTQPTPASVNEATPSVEPTPAPSADNTVTPTVTSISESSATAPVNKPIASVEPTSAASADNAVTPATKSTSESPVAPAPEQSTYTATPDSAPYNIANEIPQQAKPPSENDPIPDDTGDISKPIVVEQVKRDGSSRLRLNVVMLRAWRAVDKALSRNSIEVTERVPEERRYAIQYDPNEKKAKDGSWMDEIHFIFKGFEINEKPYRIKLVENTDYIEVQLVDDKLKLLADTDASLKLLDTLEKTIKAEFVEAKK